MPRKSWCCSAWWGQRSIDYCTVWLPLKSLGILIVIAPWILSSCSCAGFWGCPGGLASSSSSWSCPPWSDDGLTSARTAPATPSWDVWPTRRTIAGSSSLVAGRLANHQRGLLPVPQSGPCSSCPLSLGHFELWIFFFTSSVSLPLISSTPFTCVIPSAAFTHQSLLVRSSVLFRLSSQVAFVATTSWFRFPSLILFLVGFVSSWVLFFQFIFS